MTSIIPPSGFDAFAPGGDSSSPAGSGTQDMFAIYGNADFAPYYVPRRFSFSKERNLDRTENFCGNEDVSDLGAKNREMHVSGLIRETELPAFNNLLDTSDPVEMVSPGWSGEVRVMDGEFEGPRSTDPATKQYLYQYSINLVSTGRDEMGSNHGEESDPLSGPDSDNDGIPDSMDTRMGYGL